MLSTAIAWTSERSPGYLGGLGIRTSGYPPAVRRLIALVVLAAALLAGCGSSSSAPKKADPTSVALSYFPSGTPFVLTAPTDPNSAAVKQSQTLESKLPVIGFAKATLIGRLQGLGIDYQADIRPLLGNPIAIGATTPTLSGAASSQFLGAWVTKSASKLKALITKLHLPASGSHDGTQLYSAGGAAFAVDGATVLFGASPATLDAALDRHAQGGGVSGAERASETAGLPSGSALEAFGSLANVLSGPRSAKARRVPWVAAIRGYGVAVSSTSSGLAIHFRLDTTGGPLTSAELPIAGGTTPPNLAGDLPIQVAMRDPAQVVHFAEQAEQATSPVTYARFLAREAKFKRKTGLDLNSLVAQLTGNLILESDTHTTIGRVTVSNPTIAARDLQKLVAAPQSIFKATTRFTSLGGGLYQVKTPRMTLTVGVVAGQLVVGRATPAQIRSFASAPSTPASAGTGSLAFKVALAELLRLKLKHPPSATEQALFNLLGDVTGSSSASPSGLSGIAALSLR